LAAFYAAIFTLSVLVLGSVTYLAATRALDSQIGARVLAEVASLREESVTDGRAVTIRLMHDRQDARAFAGLEYGLYDRRGARLFGDLPPFPIAQGWHLIEGPPDGDESEGEHERLSAYTERLPDGSWLVVAGDVNRVAELGNVILDASAWGIALAFILAIVGGTALSALFLSRVDAIGRTAEAIIGGDIKRRIPLRGANDDLDRLSATLNRMLDRIADLMDTIGQVTIDIAHDLRTPIGRLRQSLDEAGRSAATPEEFRAAIGCAIAEADSILVTFAALLRIAQIETGKRRAGFKRLDLTALVEDVAQAFGPAAEDAGKLFATDIESNIEVEGDRELLVQLLANLIENAIVHTTEGTCIRVSLARGDTGPTLTVYDTGTGVPAHEHERIFRRFYRLEPSRNTRGSGLGLSLVAAIAELHEAKIEVADNGPGLRVTVRFAWPPSQVSTSAAHERNALAAQ
jgi:signal transduction histidine kinase